MVEENKTFENKTKESFSEHLQNLRKCLAEKKLLGDLAIRSGAKSRTVQYALTAKSFPELKGLKLKVYQEALKMKAELDVLCENFADEN